MRRRSSDDEFPLLAANGLYAANIRGDGNCLFSALSDQIYGNPNQHQKIRASVIEYMRDHAENFKQFIEVHAGGGTRRNPKRKNAGAYSTPGSMLVPTTEEVQKNFESHLARMSKGGTYGGNLELSAFTAAFNVDVKIYQRAFAYMMTAGNDNEGGEERPVAHIAYHTWEHYSSVRNIDGPHTGPPNVQMSTASPDTEKNQTQTLGNPAAGIPSWVVDEAMQFLPHMTDKSLVKQTLEQENGNIESAVSKLLAASERGGLSSARDSSSVEREPDSDDEARLSGDGPNKKQDRRVSKATRQILKLNHRARESSEASERLPRIDLTLAENGEEKKAIRRGMVDTYDPALSGDTYTTTSKDGDTTGSEYSDLSFNAQRPAVPATTASRNLSMGDGLSPEKVPTSKKAQQPKQKRPTARDTKQTKKAAQKAAAKKRKQAKVATATKTTASTPTTTPETTTNTATTMKKTTGLSVRMGKENTPVIANTIKTLYI
ncbi:MAG: hypothetical protein M1816_005241 [Peltula sp. TS41687]|nr:MAG: hypothetical protein M1816_005241 [Peltula sp. TS41687]